MHYRRDLQITHLDTTGIRYVVDVTTVDVTAASYRLGASQEDGAAARKAEARKTREYRSKVDGRKIRLIPAAVELNGRWGDGMVSLFNYPLNPSKYGPIVSINKRMPIVHRCIRIPNIVL